MPALDQISIPIATELSPRAEWIADRLAIAARKRLLPVRFAYLLAKVVLVQGVRFRVANGRWQRMPLKHRLTMVLADA